MGRQDHGFRTRADDDYYRPSLKINSVSKAKVKFSRSRRKFVANRRRPVEAVASAVTESSDGDDDDDDDDNNNDVIEHDESLEAWPTSLRR